MKANEIGKMILYNLKKTREARGMTQKQLGEAVLLSERTIINLEHDNSTTENNAKRLAIILGVPVQQLKGDKQ